MVCVTSQMQNTAVLWCSQSPSAAPCGPSRACRRTSRCKPVASQPPHIFLMMTVDLKKFWWERWLRLNRLFFSQNCHNSGWTTSSQLNQHEETSSRGPFPGSWSCDPGLWLKINTRSMVWSTQLLPQRCPPPLLNSTQVAACTDGDPTQPGSRL